MCRLRLDGTGLCPREKVRDGGASSPAREARVLAGMSLVALARYGRLPGPLLAKQIPIIQVSSSFRLHPRLTNSAPRQVSARIFGKLIRHR
jgi:hypothetical protein